MASDDGRAMMAEIERLREENARLMEWVFHLEANRQAGASEGDPHGAVHQHTGRAPVKESTYDERSTEPPMQRASSSPATIRAPRSRIHHETIASTADLDPRDDDDSAALTCNSTAAPSVHTSVELDRLAKSMVEMKDTMTQSVTDMRDLLNTMLPFVISISTKFDAYQHQSGMHLGASPISPLYGGYAAPCCYANRASDTPSR